MSHIPVMNRGGGGGGGGLRDLQSLDHLLPDSLTPCQDSGRGGPCSLVFACLAPTPAEEENGAGDKGGQGDIGELGQTPREGLLRPGAWRIPTSS